MNNKKYFICITILLLVLGIIGFNSLGNKANLKENNRKINDNLLESEIINDEVSVINSDESKVIPTKIANNGSRIHFIKTGQSDAILLESNGKYGLVDTARPDDTRVLNYLISLNVSKLDFILITHSDVDHIGGVPLLRRFINSNTKYYYRSAHLAYNNDHYTSAMNAVSIATKIEVTNQTKVFNLGNFRIELLNTESFNNDEKKPGTNVPVNDNKESIVAYVTCNGRYGTLLTGDMESQDEYRLIPKLADRPVDVLKVAHHSWQSSTTMKFTKAIKPKYAIITNDNVLDDISTPIYYMQQKYGTKFYLTEKASNAIVVDYTNNLTVSPSSSMISNYTIRQSAGQWRQLQNGIWFYIRNGNDLNTIIYSEWIKYNNKWYYLGLQGNMLTGFIEVKYTDNNVLKPGVFYLDPNGAMLTGWQQSTEYGPYDYHKTSYNQCVYSHENYLIHGWYEYKGTWGNGRHWFYYDPVSGAMLHDTTRVINGVAYTFDHDGICVSAGC